LTHRPPVKNPIQTKSLPENRLARRFLPWLRIRGASHFGESPRHGCAALICTGSSMNKNIFYIIGVIVVIVIVLKLLGVF